MMLRLSLINIFKFCWVSPIKQNILTLSDSSKRRVQISRTPYQRSWNLETVAGQKFIFTKPVFSLSCICWTFRSRKFVNAQLQNLKGNILWFRTISILYECTCINETKLWKCLFKRWYCIIILLIGIHSLRNVSDNNVSTIQIFGGNSGTFPNHTTLKAVDTVGSYSK